MTPPDAADAAAAESGGGDALAADVVVAAAAASTCANGVKDGDETGVDCGGADCVGCALGDRCVSSRDCSATDVGCDVPNGGCYCDVATRTCVYGHCDDHVTDANETDTDCGGGTCPACPTGLACLGDGDCQSNACDTLTLRCIANPCADHRLDGNESDIDCGGSCPLCVHGQKCRSNADCVPGVFCDSANVCD